MEVSIRDIIMQFVGGLGLFLFGLNYMSNSLQAVAGDKMRSILETGTKSPLRGVLMGTLVTALIQSSSATTVLVIGLVNAGLLTLRRSIGIIMGANIGTTVTAFLIGFNLQEYTLPLLAISAFVILFSKNVKYSNIAKSIFGFSLLFLGLSLMGDGMKPLRDLPAFVDAIANIGNNSLLGVLVGTAFTLVVQSSSATIGVLQELANQGIITYQQAVPILFGDNIGTTITAILASIGASVAAKRTAFTHFFFNIIGTLIFLPLFLLGIFTPMVAFTSDYLFALIPGFDQTFAMMNVKLQLAQTHAVFNICNTAIQLPFIGVLAWIVTKFIPGKPESEELQQMRPLYIDKRFLNNPAVALRQSTREAVRMGELCMKAFSYAIEYWTTHDKSVLEKSKTTENLIDNLEREITDYVAQASRIGFNEKDSAAAYVLLSSLHDMERIGDHCENIIHQTDYADKYDVTFSGEAQLELASMVNLTGETIRITIDSLDKDDRTLARQVLVNENIIDKMQRDYRKSHIKRLNAGICNGNNGAVFMELLGNLERISDHCRNIARYVLREE